MEHLKKDLALSSAKLMLFILILGIKMSYTDKENTVAFARLLNRLNASPVDSEIGYYYYNTMFCSSSEAKEILIKDGYIIESDKYAHMGKCYVLTSLAFSVLDELSPLERAQSGVSVVWLIIKNAQEQLKGFPDGDQLNDLYDSLLKTLGKYKPPPFEKAFVYRVLGEINTVRGDYDRALNDLRIALAVDPDVGVKRMIKDLEREISNAGI